MATPPMSCHSCRSCLKPLSPALVFPGLSLAGLEPELVCPLEGTANLGLSGSLWGWPREPVHPQMSPGKGEEDRCKGTAAGPGGRGEAEGVHRLSPGTARRQSQEGDSKKNGGV